MTLSTILRNAVTNYLREIVQILVFLGLTPFIAQKLGVDGFGLWSLIWSVIGLMGLLDLGLANAVVKFVADARGKNDVDRLRTITATLFGTYSALAVLMISGSIVAYPLIGQYLQIEPAVRAVAELCFLLLSMRAAVSLWSSLFRGILIGYQRQVWHNVISMIEVILYAILVVSVFTFKPSIIYLAGINLGTHVLATIWAGWYSVTRCDGVSLHYRNYAVSQLRGILGFFACFFVVQTALLLYGRVDALIINHTLTLTAVALYTVVQRITEKAGVFCRQLVNALTPVVAELYGRQDTAEIQRIYILGSRLSAAVAIPLLLGLGWFLDDLIVAWMGQDFSDATGAGRILLVATFLSVIHANSSNVLTMAGHQRFVAGYFIGGQILNIILTLLLVQPYGLAGVAFATLISNAIIEMFVVQPRVKRLYDIGLVRFYRMTLIPAFPACLAMMTVLSAAEYLWPANSLLRIGTMELVGLLTFGVMYYLFGLNAMERNWCKSVARKFAQRFMVNRKYRRFVSSLSKVTDITGSERI